MGRDEDSPPPTEGSCGAPCAGTEEEGEPAAEEMAPPWLAETETAAATRIDVRPLLAAHEKPFAAVMRAADETAVGGLLVIDAPFNPGPLRRVLEGSGFVTFGRRLDSRHWRIFCRREAAGAAAGTPAGPRLWREGDVVHIDVRGLEAPAPLTAILALIDGGAHAGTIVVHHHRDPLFLYPELAERGWQATPVPAAAGEVRLELRRQT